MTKTTVLIALFAAFIAALGLLPKFTLASGVPITAQSLAVMLCGTLLGARNGALAVLLFLLLVALGLPLLAGGRGGFGVFVAPSAGFLIGWPFAAFTTGLIMQRLGSIALASRATIAAIIGCIIVMYIFGIAGLAVMLEKSLYSATLLVAPFIIGDSIKAVIAGLLTASLIKARPDAFENIPHHTENTKRQ